MGEAVSREIERFAENAFALVRDDILKERAKKQNQVLERVGRTRNAGAYLPTLIKSEEKLVKKLIVAWAKTYTETFTRYGVPCDQHLEHSFKTFAQQTTAGCISGIRGQLRLHAVRLRTEEGVGVPWHLEIERAMDEAVKKGLFLMQGQRLDILKNPPSLERLPKDDPNYKIAERFHLEAWADSHGLVADTLEGKVSFPDWVKSCVKGFAHAAATQVAFVDSSTVDQKCAELDRMGDAFVHQFTNTLRRHSKGIGKANVQAAIEYLSRNVFQIAARSKQRIFQQALERTLAVKTHGGGARHHSGQKTSEAAASTRDVLVSRGGRPIDDRAGRLHEAWIARGRPQLTVEFCDEMAKVFFPADFAKAIRGTKAHKNLRDRIGNAIRRAEQRTATKPVS